MCAGRGEKKRICYHRRACEAHRFYAVENNQSERRMLKSWLDVCRQTEQHPEKIDADTSDIIALLVVGGWISFAARFFA